MKLKHTLPIVLLAGLVSSCESMGGFRPHRSYVEADRATFDTLAPVVRDLADSDPTNDPDLSGVNGEAVLSLVESWQLRLEAAEEQLR